MEATMEISLYPLRDNYKDQVKKFINKIRRHKGLKIESNGMSTQIFGQYDDIMQALTVDMRETLDEQQAMIVLKIGKGNLRFDVSELDS